MIKFTKINQRLFKYFFILLLYKALLDIIYITRISSHWYYMGFMRNGNFYTYIISWFIFIILIPFVMSNLLKKNVSNLVISIFNLIVLIPSITIMGFQYTNINMILIYLLYWILLNSLNFYVPFIKVKDIGTKKARIIFYLILLFIVSLLLYVSYRYAGFRIDFNIFNAYEYREEAVNYRMGTLVSYLYSNARNILPIFIIYSLILKNRVMYIFLFIVGLLTYSVTGSKSILFAYILTYIIYLFREINITKKLPRIFLLITLLSLLEKIFLRSYYIIDVFLRRVFFIPGLLNYFYYDFFSNNEFDYLRQSFMRIFGFRSPYNIRIPQLIGDIYFNGAYANAGLFSDAFYNFGVIGVITFPVIIVMILKVYEGYTYNLDNRVVLASLLTVIFSLINSSLGVVLITHGMLLSILVLYFYPKSNKINLNNY